MDWKRFQVKPGSKVRLRDIDPDDTGSMEADAARARTRYNYERLRALQELLYAEHKRALLVCLQAMDAGGKDGVIRHVFGAMDPQGCRVASFKQPTSLELDHDFMWRAIRDLPALGEVVVFNRSHYEDVLVVRTKKLVPKSVWSKRYGQINAVEHYLAENNTHILKFFLHISKDEQLKRFRQRLDDPSKHWKISESDYTERERWDEYREAFEDMLSRCSTAHAPWFVIPANRKWFRNFAVSEILVSYLENLNMAYPATSIDVRRLRRQYFPRKKKE